MTRSLKKHPYGSYYTTESDRPWKRLAHRHERRSIRHRLRVEPMADILPHRKEFGDQSEFGKGTKVFVPMLLMRGWEMSSRQLLRWLRK